jgi:protein required for attachment to host cells
METTWILVGDASRARLFAFEHPLRAWSLLEELEHPEGRERTHDQVSDRQGRSPRRGRGTYSTAMEPHSDPSEEGAKHFAQLLAARLEQGHRRDAFRHVVLVAPPHFLGLLRESLSAPVAAQVSASLDKDFTQIAPKELEARLQDAVLGVLH